MSPDRLYGRQLSFGDKINAAFLQAEIEDQTTSDALKLLACNIILVLISS